MSRFFLIILFLFTSCALFKTKPSLVNTPIEMILNSIQLDGEGRGRVTVDQHQYLFGFESSLQDNFDWILAAQISLHGEEAITLTNLKLQNAPEEGVDSFRNRIEEEMRKFLIRKPYLPKDLSTKFFPELRNLVRFVMSKRLDLKRSCVSSARGRFECDFEKSKFILEIGHDEVRIKKYIEEKYFVELHAKNLTVSIFEFISFNLRPEGSNGEKTSPILALELFYN